MALIATRVLVINKQLGFTIGIKQALEQAGGFEVTPFTTWDTALDHLRQRPHDVALVDFTLSGMPGIDLVFRLRAIQPDIAIIATPDTPDVAEHVRTLKLNGIVDVPVSARELMPILHDAITQIHDSLPETSEAPVLTDSETLLIEDLPAAPPDFSSLDSVLIRLGGLELPEESETLDVDMSDAGYAESGSHEPQSIELILTGNLTTLKRQSETKKDDVFEQLAAEEPPMPSLEEGGTVSDLIVSMNATDLKEVAEIMIRNQAMPEPAPPVEDEDEDTPAKVILQNALDESSPLALSLDELVKNIERQFPENAQGVKPLPSWVQDIERYVREPDFLDTQTILTLDESFDVSVQTTQMTHLEEIEAEPGNIETEVIAAEFADIADMQPISEQETPKVAEAPIQAELPPYEFPDEQEEARKEAVPEWEPVDEILSLEEEETALPDEKPPVAELPPYEFVEGPAAATDSVERAELDAALIRQRAEQATVRITGEHIAIGTESDDPRVAQLALSLTQASLELTAEATLLTQDNSIVAYAGGLPYEDLEDIRDLIGGDWEAKPGEARIRFITLPSSGQDYMLYSRQTDGGFTLSMVFAGNMPLRVIRRQSDRLVEALQKVPETAVSEAPEESYELAQLEQQVAVEEEAAQESKALLVSEQEQIAVEPPTETIRTPYTYLWLVRDAERALTPEIAQAIVRDLDQELTEKGWDVKTLNVYEDYVYLLADVPGEPMANEIIAQLKQSSAHIAQKVDSVIEPDTLWADSYCVLTPGRELRQDEIQHFINFGRSR